MDLKYLKAGFSSRDFEATNSRRELKPTCFGNRKGVSPRSRSDGEVCGFFLVREGGGGGSGSGVGMVVKWMNE